MRHWDGPPIAKIARRMWAFETHKSVDDFEAEPPDVRTCWVGYATGAVTAITELTGDLSPLTRQGSSHDRASVADKLVDAMCRLTESQFCSVVFYSGANRSRLLPDTVSLRGRVADLVATCGPRAVMTAVDRVAPHLL